MADFLELCARWLKPGGTFAFIDSRADPASGAAVNTWNPETETAVRQVGDRSFRIPKVYYAPDELVRGLAGAGFVETNVRTTSRFFLLGSARMPGERQR